MFLTRPPSCIRPAVRRTGEIGKHALRHFLWSWPDESANRADRGRAIAQVLGIPKILGLALASRAMDATRAEAIRDQTLIDSTRAIGDPDGVEEAAAKLVALARKGRVGILCDYDVDGATAQAIIVETLRAILPKGLDPVVTVPDRNREGFGPNSRCLNALSEQGVSCVAVLDCGTAAGKLLDRFQESFGIEPIVVDHHPPHDDAPPSKGNLVNPWVSRPEGPGEQGNLCAAALAWFVARAMIRQAGLSPAGTRELRKRITLLAALGTSCDVMPVDTPFNRSLIRTGVRILADGAAVPPGIRAIARLAGVREAPTSDDFGWRIGPRINAGSRMGKSTLAARCLREAQARTAGVLANQLHDLNRTRVESGRAAAAELDSSVGMELLAGGPVNVHLVHAASPGTVGLVAMSLVRRFGWPAIAVCKREDGLLAGSGRSALGFDLGATVSAARREGILISGGGHAAACGMTLEQSRLDDLRAFVCARFRKLEALSGRRLQPVHEIDGVLSGSDLSPGSLLQIAEAQQRLEPWGPGLKAPLFGVRDCTLASSRQIGTGHLFLELVSGSARTEAVWWNAPTDWRRWETNDPVGASLSDGSDQVRLEVAGRVELDDWQGRRRGRIVIRDLRPASR